MATATVASMLARSLPFLPPNATAPAELNFKLVIFGDFLSFLRNIFFPGRDRGVIGRFFAAIGGAKFLLFFARSFLTQEELDPL